MKMALQTCFIIKFDCLKQSVKTVTLYENIGKNKWKYVKYFIREMSCFDYENRELLKETVDCLVGIDSVYCSGVKDSFIVLLYTKIYDFDISQIYDYDISQQLRYFIGLNNEIIDEYLKKFLIVNNSEKIRNAVDVFIRGMR